MLSSGFALCSGGCELVTLALRNDSFVEDKPHNALFGSEHTRRRTENYARGERAAGILEGQRGQHHQKYAKNRT